MTLLDATNLVFELYLTKQEGLDYTIPESGFDLYEMLSGLLI